MPGVISRENCRESIDTRGRQSTDNELTGQNRPGQRNIPTQQGGKIDITLPRVVPNIRTFTTSSQSAVNALYYANSWVNSSRYFIVHCHHLSSIDACTR